MRKAVHCHFHYITTRLYKFILNPVTEHRVVLNVYPLTTSSRETRLLIPKTTFIDGSIFTVVNVSDLGSRLISSISKNGSAFGLTTSQVSEIWFIGAGDYEVQA